MGEVVQAAAARQHLVKAVNHKLLHFILRKRETVVVEAEVKKVLNDRELMTFSEIQLQVQHI